ncbi:unnamed protein product, partial [marine sediment metagenome]
GNSIANISYPTPASIPQGVASHGDKTYIVDAFTGNLSVYQNLVLINSSLISATLGVTVDQDGKIYVTRGSYIDVYSPDLILLDTITQSLQIEDIAVSPDGRIFATNYLNGNVTVFSPDYEIIGGIGQLGIGVGDFDYPMGIAVNLQGYIFVADHDLSRVQIYSPDLLLVGSITGILFPHGLEVDNTGRLYVTSTTGSTNNVTVWETSDLGDNEGPSITEVQINPSSPISDEDVVVSAMITDLTGIDYANLTYSYIGGNTTSLIMTSV